MHHIQDDPPSALDLFFSSMQLLKIRFSESLNKLKDDMMKFLSFLYYILKECSVEMQTFVFQMRNPFPPFRQ